MSIGLSTLVESDMTWLHKWRVVPGNFKGVGRGELMQLFTLPMSSRRVNIIFLRFPPLLRGGGKRLPERVAVRSISRFAQSRLFTLLALRNEHSGATLSSVLGTCGTLAHDVGVINDGINDGIKLRSRIITLLKTGV